MVFGLALWLSPAMADPLPAGVGRALPLGSLLGPDIPPIAQTCPPPPASPDKGGTLAAACAKVAVGGDLGAAYGNLAIVYAERGRRWPPASLSDAQLASASLVAMLQHQPAGHASLQPVLREFAFDMEGIGSQTGDPRVYQLALDAALTAEAACSSGDGALCAPTDMLLVADSLDAIGRWGGNSAALERGLALLRPIADTFSRSADTMLWVRLHSRMATLLMELSNATQQPDDHLALAKQSVAEATDIIPIVDSLPHTKDWADLEQTIAAPQGEVAFLQHDHAAAELALDRFEATLVAYDVHRDPVPWLVMQTNLSLWHQKIARLDGTDASEWMLAAFIAQSAVETVSHLTTKLPLEVAYTRLIHAISLVEAGRVTLAYGGKGLMQQASAELNQIEPVFLAAGSQRYARRVQDYQAYVASTLGPH